MRVELIGTQIVEIVLERGANGPLLSRQVPQFLAIYQP